MNREHNIDWLAANHEPEVHEIQEMQEAVDDSPAEVIIDPVKRPPFRPKIPIKCAGPYTGLGDPKVKIEQWHEIGRDLYEKGYNQISFFNILRTPMNFWPIPMTQAWKDHIFNAIRVLAHWRIGVKLKFNDQYHEGVKNDPFAHLSTEQLYSSWDGSKYAHTAWDEPIPRHYTNFRPVNAWAKQYHLYVKTVVEAAKRVKDLKASNSKPIYPDFRLIVAWANETMALFEGNDHHPIKTRGDRDEMGYWLLSLLKDAGFVLNKNLLFEVDYLAYRDSVRTVDYDIMASVSQYLTKKGQRLEIHGIKTIADIQKYIQAGVNPKSSLFSTDGDLRMEADGQDLFDSPYHVDLKVDCKLHEPFFPNNFMMFWRHYFPPYGAHKQ